MTAVRFAFLSLLVLLLSQCAPPSPPVCTRLPRDSRQPAQVYLDQARQAWTDAGQLAGSARAEAIARYNAATGHLLDQLRCGARGKGTAPGHTAHTLRTRAAAMGATIDESRTFQAGLRLADLDAIVLSSEIDTDSLGQRHTVTGAGIPVVGWHRTASEGQPRWEFEPPTGIPLNLTALLAFPPGRPPVWSFISPGKVDTVPVGTASVPLAADWSAPSALYWQLSSLDDLDLAKAMLPSRFADETKLYVATPYDPNRIPLVMVHGLNSSPGTFRKLYNELNRDPWFRKNYQVWFYSYATGNNWLYSAARFREEMSRATQYVHRQGAAPNWDRMVVIGHSMGGVITSASLKRPEGRLYNVLSTAPLETVKTSEQTRQALKLMLMYEPMQPPSRAIFMAAPLQGAPLADRLFSALLTQMIRLPKKLTVDLVDFTVNDLAAITAKGRFSSRGWFTGIGSLSPRYPAYRVLRGLPYRSGLKVDTIIGDRGRGDGDKGSDGVVPYWSAHLPGAESEKIVPCGHSVPKNREAAEETKRILQMHMGTGANIVRKEQRKGR